MVLMQAAGHRAVGATQVWVIHGDLTQQPVEAVVNAANEQLAHGGGVAAALVHTGGRVIQEESDTWVRDHGPLAAGEAAVTTAGALQATHVIHVVGPRYRRGADNELELAAAITAALDAAAAVPVRSVALPAVSAGIFGYPLAAAAATIAATVVAWLEHHVDVLDEVRLVGFDAQATEAFVTGLDSV